MTGDSANDLIGIMLDPNVLIQESKVGTCDIRPGRRSSGAELTRLIAEYHHRSGRDLDQHAPIVTVGDLAGRHGGAPIFETTAT